MKHIFSALVCASVLSISGSVSAQPETIGVDEIRPGMQGYGLTVFQGTEPERFEVEVIDVLRGFRPDQDLILIRTPHPILEQSGSVAGMSGSPIYLDGRLAGAYAYGWPFGLEPIAGVTPIRNMLHELRRPVRQGEETQSTRARLGQYTGGPLDLTNRFEPSASGDATRNAPPQLERAATPLMLAGFSSDARSYLGEVLGPLGMIPLQGGGSAASSTTSTTNRNPFVNGGAIGVQMVRGDINATAIGTITYVDSNRLVAFGHPMMNIGQSLLPTCEARVLHILASRNRSFKIAEALQPRGTLIHDRQAAIVVDTSRTASTIPMTIELRGLQEPPRNRWEVEIANHRDLTTVLASASLLNAIQTSESDRTPVAFSARSRIQIAGHGVRELHERGYMEAGPAGSRELLSLRAFRVIEAALNNPFETATVESIDMQVSFDFGTHYATVIEAASPVHEVDPGATVPLVIRERRFNQPEQTRVIPFVVPQEAAGTTLQVSIHAGASAPQEIAPPTNLSELLSNIEMAFPGNSLIVAARLRQRGLRFRGHLAEHLPRSALASLMPTNRTNDVRSFASHTRQVVETEEFMRGSTSLSLRVRSTPREP